MNPVNVVVTAENACSHFTPARWQALCRALAVPLAHTASTRFDEVQAAYAQPQRHYHTAQHIAECLAQLDAIVAPPEGCLLQDAPLVELAIWLHDLVYDPTAKDNEARSAELAQQWFAGALAPARLQRLGGWIEATRLHEAAPQDADLQALLDIDLAILAAAPARFVEYEAQVAREYAHIPPALFSQGRRAFLSELLVRAQLFHHPALTQLEAPARRNLVASVGLVSGGVGMRR
jgi:predicted metal-dependent HD superfamily phosphohydrolase